MPRLVAVEAASDVRTLPGRRLCAVDGCGKAATTGVTTQRPTRANLWTKVWWDEAQAPKAAIRYCGEHTAETLAQLAEVLA